MVLTNMSNWDGEDYYVSHQNEDGGVLLDERLKPGESVTIVPHSTDTIRFAPVESKEIKPFYMNGRHMTPRADGSFEQAISRPKKD